MSEFEFKDISEYKIISKIDGLKYVVEIPMEVFFKIPNFYKNRNHEDRALEVKHLIPSLHKNDVLYQEVMAFAFKQNPKLVQKLDGHTRCEIWKNLYKDKNYDMVPKSVFLSVYLVDNIEDADNKFKKIDSKKTVKTSHDFIYGYFRKNNFEPKSKLVKKPKWKWAFKALNSEFFNDGFVDRGENEEYVERCVDVFINEIRLIDNLFINLENTNSLIRERFKGALVPMLLTIKKDGAYAINFWREYFSQKVIDWGSNSFTCIDSTLDMFRHFRAYSITNGVLSKIDSDFDIKSGRLSSSASISELKKIEQISFVAYCYLYNYEIYKKDGFTILEHKSNFFNKIDQVHNLVYEKVVNYDTNNVEYLKLDENPLLLKYRT